MKGNTNKQGKIKRCVGNGEGGSCMLQNIRYGDCDVSCCSAGYEVIIGSVRNASKRLVSSGEAGQADSSSL